MDQVDVSSLAPTVTHTNPDSRAVIWHEPNGIWANVGTKHGMVPDVNDNSVLVMDGGTSRFLLERIKSDRDIAAQMVAMETLWAFHDAVEFIHVEGSPLANPHPGYLDEGDEEMFKWLLGKLTDLTEEYAERYPMGADDA